MKKTLYLFVIAAVLFGCKSKTSGNHSHDENGNHETHEVKGHDSHEGHNHSPGERHDHSLQETEADGIVLKSGNITLSEAKSLPIIDAKLSVKKPIDGEVYKRMMKFDFDVENYKLGSQTQDKNAEHCANSAKGQHIHLILNNSPYTAHYEEDFEKELEDGRYIGLAFLSRSYHESIKTKDAYQLFKFSVGKDQDLLEFETTDPHMFYSRPKGTYTGADAKHVLLDFYLTNVDLSEDGYTVHARINDERFVITKWQPFVMEGLPMGKNIIELTLMDSEGNKVKSPFNPVTRTVTLEPEAS